MAVTRWVLGCALAVISLQTSAAADSAKAEQACVALSGLRIPTGAIGLATGGARVAKDFCCS